MYELIDQIFVKLGGFIFKLVQWLFVTCGGAGMPRWFATLLWIALTVLPIIALFPFIFAMTTWVERKLLGRIQNRIGPNRTGPVGLFQPIADGIKTLTKEDIVPARADH